MAASSLAFQMKTLRTTTGAAIVRFLQSQYVRRDGIEHRLIQGIAGIFGHGNVAGLRQSIEEHSSNAPPDFQPKNEQTKGHTAIAYPKTKKRPVSLACTPSPCRPATTAV